MKEITDVAVEAFSPVLILIIQALGVIVAGYAIKGVKMIVKKVGLDVDSAEFKKITELVDSAVIKTNQKVVSKLKAASERGKLTEEQEEEVFNISKNALLSILDSAQVQKIIAKYGDLDEGIETLIENSVSYNKGVSTAVLSSTELDQDTIAEKIGEVLANIFGDDEDDEDIELPGALSYDEAAKQLAEQVDKEVMDYVNSPSVPETTPSDVTVTTATTEEAADWNESTTETESVQETETTETTETVATEEDR